MKKLTAFLVVFILAGLPARASDEELLVDAVYKLMVKVQRIEKELEELKEKQGIDSQKISELQLKLREISGKLQEISGQDTSSAGRNAVKLVVGTFFSPENARHQLLKISKVLPYRVFQKQAYCRDRKCWVNYVIVSPEEIPKVRRVIPDAYVVSLKLKSKLKVDATKDAIKDAIEKDAKDADANAANQ